MASNTKNVKLGVCQVFFDGYDLGYTKGGVEVSVKTDTHKVNIDQFGKTSINELVMGREVTAKVPMAETTVDNMCAIMPGATLTQTGGTAATGTITIATNPSANDTILVNGRTLTFKAAAADPLTEVTIGANAAATAVNLAAMLQANTDPAIATASYTVAGAVVTVKYGTPMIYGSAGMQAAEGNAFSLNAGTAGAKVTLSGATLTGGVDATSKSVDVSTGIGNDLLTLARELRFHPVGKAITDRSDDFVIPLAGTPGALTFAYKLEDERVFNVDFTGYPDPVTQKLFYVGR
jgi:hypothetical protein